MDRINKKNKHSSLGFALLYSVVIASIILSISLGISNIALREIVFGTSMKEGNDAFYAADTAIECVLQLDRAGSNNVFLGPCEDATLCNTVCNNNNFNIGSPIEMSNAIKFEFGMSGLGTSGKSCAKVTLTKTTVAVIPPDTGNTITAIGYNSHLSTDLVGECNSLDNSVQRAIEVSY